MSSVVDVIQHYQRSIEKCGEDEKRMLHCINKLCRLPITVQHLKETGVGRTVNLLRKYEGQVGEAAKYTVTKWKQMVADEESSEDDGDTAATEAYAENVGEDYVRADEEEEPDDEYNISVMADNLRHAHRESHSKSRKHDNHRSHANKSEHKMEKEKPQRDADQNKKKHKEHHKYEDLNHTEEKQSHKRKSNSSKSHKVEEKRRKYESDNENVSENDSESEEMQIDEGNQGSYAATGTDEEMEEEEEEQQQEEKDDSDDNDSDNRGSMSDSSSRLMASSHTHNSKHHSSTSGRHHSGPSSVHHSKHHKESHRKHEKHKEKKSSSSDKHSRKNDSDKASEKTSDSNNKDKHSKHRDNKQEHRNSKHKNSSSISSSNNNSGETSKEKERVKHKTDSFVKDSELQTAGNKKKSKEKTESAEKTSSSTKHQKSSNTKTKESKDKKRKNTILDDDDDDGITSTSGASFAEALGMFDPMIKKKTSSFGHSSNTKAPRNTNSKVSTVAEKSVTKSKEIKTPKVIPSVKEEPDLLSSAVKLEPLKVDLDATLPEISPNYRPLPHPNMDAFPQRKTKTMSDEDALALAMSQKNQRTRVYSGMRSGKSWSSVPSLFDICVRVLQEHIEAIEYTGGVPYDLLKPILNIATPEQLFNLEHYNPYLVDDTDGLWEFHCKKSFRMKQPEDMETWRDMYIRCVEEREAKLKALTSNIQQSIAKSTPVRQTKLAYVDSVVKPPRNVAKQQAKYGTATTSSANKGSPQKGPKTGISGQNAGASMSAHAAHMPPPRSVQSVPKVKPRMAPLMQKTMKLVKSFKR